MKLSKSLSKMNSKTNKLSLIFTAILSFLGFVDSTYLTIVHYKNIIPPCSITQDCGKVLASKFATIASIPISLFGSIFFILILVICILLLPSQTRLLQKNQKRLRQALFILATLGIITGIILFYIQWVVLKAFCQYCLLVEVITLAIFILSYPFNSSTR